MIFQKKKFVIKLPKSDPIVIDENHMPTGILDADNIIIYLHIKHRHMLHQMKMTVYLRYS
jgi:hypothetical protein